MKKLILILALIPAFSLANWEDIIQQEENQLKQKQIKILNEDFKLEKFDTQQDFEKFLIDKLYKKIIENCYYNYYYTIYRHTLGSVHILEKATSSAEKIENITNNVGTETNTDQALDSISSTTSSYSKTNIQKQNVDEPEILKLNSQYIAYYNKKLGKILIIKGPISSGKTNIDQVNITDEIKIPSIINKYSIKLFFINNQLIVIGSRYSNALGQVITDLVFYKIENGKAKFSRLYDVRGNFKDARITNNKIYLITDYRFNSNKICKIISGPVPRPLLDKNNLKNSIPTNDKIKKQIEKSINQQKDKISKEEIIKQIKKTINPTSIDIYFDKNKKYEINGKIYPLGIRLVNSATNNILFVPTDWNDINLYNIHFNVINIIDLDKGKNPNQYIIFGNISNGEIHMTTKSLYLVNNYYKDYPWRCRPGLVCILPYYPRGDFTLIHKLQINGFNLDYINSQIIPGRPINQYSMDEDILGNFRIFTKHYYPQKATDLYAFNKDLELVGQLTNIAPGEDFKSSRFIEDKAYLVTFKATDPLFVIDLKDIKNPKIIGELKIPGYSLYLHPLWSNGNIQYLLGIGQQAKEVYGNRSLPKNIKIDLYKIDYSQKSGDYVQVEQSSSLILGKETKYKNNGSYTPVFDNPRTFVSLKSEERKEIGREKFIVFLPVYLTEDKIEKKCYETYTWENGEKNIESQRCYDYVTKAPYFIGIKSLQITLSGITQIPSLSKNLIKYYEQPTNQWQYKGENHRCGYYKTNDKLVPFEINTHFIDIYTEEKEKNIQFK